MVDINFLQYFNMTRKDNLIIYKYVHVHVYIEGRLKMYM